MDAIIARYARIPPGLSAARHSLSVCQRTCKDATPRRQACDYVRIAWEHLFDPAVNVTQAYRFALDPSPRAERKLRAHTGASRFAYNFGLALVKERLDARGRGEDVDVPWTLPALRREWNRVKAEVAPWWPENSKEAYSSGLDALARALTAFSDFRKGKRQGPRVGFPRFKRKGRSRDSCRFTTGAIGIASRTGVKLPRIGKVRTHEPTTKLIKLIDAGKARILSATISSEGDRWFCSFACQVDREDAEALQSDEVVGLDRGIAHLAVTSEGERYENPKPLRKAQAKLRRFQRRLDRQRRSNNPDCFDSRGRAIGGKRPMRCSRRMRLTERKVRRLHARVRSLRGDAHHKLATKIARAYGTVVVESLNVSGMLRNHKLAQALADAGMAEIDRLLTYKLHWRGGVLVKADPFFPSSKMCASCGTVKAKLSLAERTFRCEEPGCGWVCDRDLNAAINLKHLVDPSGGDTQTSAWRPGKTSLGEAQACEARTRQPVRRKTGTVAEQSATDRVQLLQATDVR